MINNLPQKKEGAVIWFIGLPSAGKSTLAEKTCEELNKRKLPAEWLDGDDFRKKFNFDLNFTADDRIKNIKRAGYITRMLVKNGINVVASFITPYENQRKILRKEFKNYIEVFVDAPLVICQKRDTRGYYKKAKSGKIKNFTGLGDSFEKPKSPSIYLKTDTQNVEDCLGTIFDYLVRNGFC